MKCAGTRMVKQAQTLCAVLLFCAASLPAQQIAVTPGIITTIAGIPGSTTVGSAANCPGAATSCSLYFGSGDYAEKAVMDSAGNIYFADRYFNVVRKLAPVTPPGTGNNVFGNNTTYTMTTVAGSSSPVACPGTANAVQGLESPTFGDGCAATSATLSNPFSVALNRAGTILFISDLSHGTIRAVNLSTTSQTFGSITLAAGDIYTVMGTGSRTSPADSESGTSIATSDPIQGAHGISLDANGNLIVADYSANSVRKLTPSSAGNTVTTIIGGNTTSAASPVIVGSGSTCTNTTAAYGSGPCGDGNSAGPATTPSTNAAVQVSTPEYAVVDSLGNLYVADATLDFRVRAVNTTAATETLFGVPIAAGTIGTVAGDGVAGTTGDGGNAAENPSSSKSSAEVNSPDHLSLDTAGSLYVTDANANEIRRVDPTGIINTLVGHYGVTTVCSQATDTIGDGCPSTSATLKNPTAAIVDPFGNIVIVDAGNSVIRQVSATSSTLNFGSQGVGVTSAPQTLTLYNTGSKPLVLSSLSVTGNFSQSGGSCTATSTLAAGGSCTILVVFTPQTVASLTGAVNVSSNASNVLSIGLIGTGTQATSTTTVTASPNPANVGQSVTITATVTGGGSTPTGSVMLNVGSTAVGPLTLTSAGSGTATATYSTSTLAAGSYTVTATYSGSTTYAASTSSSTTLAVSSIPVTTTTLTLSPSAPVYGQSVTLNASVSSQSAATGTVTFADGSVVLGVVSISGGKAVLTLSGLPLGPNNLTANYSGDANNLGSTSNTTAVNIVEGPAVLFTPAVISTVVGSGLLGYTGDGAAATSATLNTVNGVALDASGNIYVADTGNNAIRVVNMQTSAITVAGVTIPAGAIQTVVGNGAVCSSSTLTACGDGGSPTAATLNSPAYVRLDAAGNIYIADTKDNAIRVVNTQNQAVTIAGTKISPSTIMTIAGNGTACATPTGTNACGDGGAASASQIKTPRGVFIDPAGDIYIADNGDYRVRVINHTTNIITTVAGSGTSCNNSTCGDGGAATSAGFGSMHAIWVDSKGQLYIADDTDHRVRLVNTTGVISTIVGTGAAGIAVSGVAATSTPIYYPGDVIADGAGDIYVPLQTNVIAMVNAAGILTFIAGTGTPNPLVTPTCTTNTSTTTGSCYSGDGGSAQKAQLNNPESIAMDPAGNLYFTDSNNNVVRKISIGASLAAFANQPEGTESSAQTIGVLNAGGQPLQLGQFNFPTGFLQETVGSDCSASGTLASAASCALGIGFMPPTATMYAGNAAIASNSVNATGGTNLIGLTGTGTYVMPVVTLTSSISFGNEPVGTPSAAQTLTLSNTGTSPFPISSAVLGDTTNFAATTNCPTVLSAGSSCTYSIVFNPTSAGAFMTNFTVTDSTDSVSASAQLSGTGTVPGVTLSAMTLSLGTQPVDVSGTPQSITVTNSGLAPLVVSSIAFTGANAADFSQTSNCIGSIAAGANCTIQVTFTPASIASFTANLVLTDNAPNSPQTVTVSGTGVAQAPAIALTPTMLAFGSVPVGTSSAAQVVTVKNSGTASLSLSGVVINGSGYAETTTCGSQLATNATCTVTVVFTPTSATLSSGSLTFTDNAAGSPQSVALSGTGTAPQAVISPNPISFGSQSTVVASSPILVSLSNPGNAVLNISSIAITGTNANLFSQTNNCGGSLAANGSCTISITFAPNADGPDVASLVVTDTAAGSPQSVPITGTGTAPAPAVTLSSTSVSFGQVALGSTASPQTITLTNSGSASLAIASIAVSGAGFSGTNTCGTQLAASAKCTISVSFQPTTASAANGSVTITDNALGTAGSIQTIALTGTGTAPSVTFNPTTINFGTTVPGTPANNQTLVVTNSGNASLAISNFLISGNTGTVFTLSTNCSNSLAAGASCNVTLGFNPANAASYSATFNLVDNVNNVVGSVQTVALTGVGQYPGSFILSAPSAVTETVPAGNSTNFTILVSPSTGSYNGPVTFAISGQPSGTVALFSPTSVVPGATGASTNLFLEIPVAKLDRPVFGQRSTPLLALIFALPLLGFGGVRRRIARARGASLLCMLILISLGAASGCGSSSTAPPKVTSYPITITGTSGTLQSTTSVTLVVENY